MHTIHQLSVGGGHYEVGQAIGKHFAESIREFMKNYTSLQTELLPFCKSSDGKKLLASFIELHQNRFPGYCKEIEGMAEGVGLDYEEMFVASLRGEIHGLMEAESSKGGDDCTDCIVLDENNALIGHNEDGTPAGFGNMYLIHVHVDGEPAFYVFSYPGFLPGNAFGFNEAGVGHTVNALHPKNIRLGIGRHFVARSLLEARTLDDAVQRATVSDQACGFNYNIASTALRRIVAVETAPEGHHVHEVKGCYVHSNHYIHLKEVAQDITPTSKTRLERAKAVVSEKPPSSPEDVLTLLADRTDKDYPIRAGAVPPEENATLSTALYDLDRKKVRIYPNHPVDDANTYLELDF